MNLKLLIKGFVYIVSISLFISCSSNEEKTWSQYEEEFEIEKRNRISELKEQISDSLTQQEIAGLKLKEIKKISFFERDFVNSVKAFDRENNENRYGKLKAISANKKRTFFDLYIELTEKYKIAELQSRIKAMESGLREDHYYEFQGEIEDNYEIEFCNKYGISRDLFMSFRNNFASCLGDGSKEYCNGLKPLLPMQNTGNSKACNRLFVACNSTSS